MEIKGEACGMVDEKRFYLRGVKLADQCPKCSETRKVDFGEEYLSYPVVGKPFDYFMCCERCGHEWSVKLVLEITLARAAFNAMPASEKS